jgi:uncharacterized protein involved in exopolysaccharide biosynthesis
MGEKTSETKKPEIQMIPVQYVPYCEEEEIDLKELIKKILARKYFILGFTFFVTLLGTIYAFIAKPVYEIKGYLQVGHINVITPQNILKLYPISPNFLKFYIENNYDQSKNPKKQFPQVKVNKEKKAEDILKIVIDARSNKNAIEYLNKILKDIRQQEKRKIDSYVSETKKQIKTLEKEKEMLERELQRIKNSPNYGEILLKIGDKLSNINLKLNMLKQKISPLNISLSHLVGKVIYEDSPVKPKKKLIIVVSFITSLILSIFLIFLWDFWKELKED